MRKTPTRQNAIEALEFARDAILLDLNNIYRSLLEDALKGAFGKEIALGIQKDLILMREAKQNIEDAIATLQSVNLGTQYQKQVNDENTPCSL